VLTLVVEKSVETPSVPALELDVAVVEFAGSSTALTIFSVRLSCKSSFPMVTLSAVVGAVGFAGPASAAWYAVNAVVASVVLPSFTAVATAPRKVFKESDFPVVPGDCDWIDFKMLWVVLRFPDEIDFSS
jgi:hypothetical protein